MAVKTAFVFPGQGSQSLKMMDGLLESQPVQKVFAQAKETLGVDFLAMLQEDTAELINQTVNTQPLLLVSGYATYNHYIKNGGKLPDVVAGHSLGEWTALVASGVISFADALNLVKLRATSMQEAVPSGVGAMAAVIGLDDQTVVTVCAEVAKETQLVISGVNFNSPGQVVVAGNKEAVEVAAVKLKENGAKMVKQLPVSVPSHCALMLPAAKKMEEALSTITFNAPQIPILHNYNTESHTDVSLIKEALVKQLYMPVLWTGVINKIVAMGINNIIECGPGKVLTGLNKRINKEIVSYNIHNVNDFDAVLSL